ncbi:hypothetical protein GGR16_002087 [Chelatococcus caeni]|uniref:Uncharacterized protein n=1 Tax=Chelatococcus caeni TaxID=1348468 RepID=A0A840C054_9HYPH|nr:hypothetical protein [Chelatococcus caeni]MBB4017058.1 hypothetical protein [Chelatococcus caeni]
MLQLAMNNIINHPAKYSPALTFDVTQQTIRYTGGIVRALPRGVAYEVDGFFIGMFADDVGLRAITPGYAMTQAVTGVELHSWVENVFGAKNIIEMLNRPGECYRRKWRPGSDGARHSQLYLAPSAHAITQIGIYGAPI